VRTLVQVVLVTFPFWFGPACFAALWLFLRHKELV
jgi:hypothetical protein